MGHHRSFSFFLIWFFWFLLDVFLDRCWSNILTIFVMLWCSRNNQIENSLPTESFWINKTKDNPDLYILPCFKQKQEKSRSIKQFTSFKKLNNRQYFRQAKNEFSELLGVGMVPISAISVLDLAPAGCKLSEVGFRSKY